MHVNNSLVIEIRGTQHQVQLLSSEYCVLSSSGSTIHSSGRGPDISLIRTIGSARCKINFTNDCRYKVVCIYGLGR